MKYLFSQNQKKYSERGFMMLYAILISTVILTISLGALNVILKSISLSGAVRESHYAFYAANAAAECALYHDIILGDFGLTAPPGSAPAVACETPGSSITTTMVSVSPDEYVFSFEVPYDFGLGVGDIACAFVEVRKNYTTFDSSITSRGYNISPCVATKPNKVERGLQVDY